MLPILVRDIMSSPVVTFFAEQSLPLAEEIMRLKHLRHLPVVDENQQLVGLLSHRDMLRAQISSLSGLTDAERRVRQAGVKIRDVMTREVWTVSADTLASTAAQTLLDHTFGCLPVVDPDNQVIGIVTERDFLRYAVRTLSARDTAID